MTETKNESGAKPSIVVESRDATSDDKQGESADSHESKPAVVFNARNRSRKARARPRHGAKSDEDNAKPGLELEKHAESATKPEHGRAVSDDDDGDEAAAVNVAVLRKAQRLRERARVADVSASARRRVQAKDEKPSPAAGGGSEAGVGGLRSNFAVESSGYDAQRNMEEFVEQRMAEKYGSRVSGRDDDGAGDDDEIDGVQKPKRDGARTDDDEAQLYVVPAHLRVAQRAQYDPSEGLPAAGVEEVDIGAAARRKNAEATAAARRQMVQGDGGGRSARAPQSAVMGNVSANYAKHRREWIEANLGPARQPYGGREERKGGSGRGADARAGATDGTGDGGRGKRPAGVSLATDHIVADRFRKRWRH